MRPETRPDHNLTFRYLPADQAKTTYVDKGNFTWATEVEQNWKTIRDEILAHRNLHANDYEPYFDKAMTGEGGKWRSFGFYFWGKSLEPSKLQEFSETVSVLKKIPGLVSASVSVMEPHSEIKPHYGETDAIYRCHLPLVVPASLPTTGFQVGYEQRSWEEGKLLVFNDAAYHKGWNNSDQERVVLIFDVVRPELTGWIKRICATAHANIELHKKLAADPDLGSRSNNHLISLRNRLAFKFWLGFLFGGIGLRA